MHYGGIENCFGGLKHTNYTISNFTKKIENMKEDLKKEMISRTSKIEVLGQELDLSREQNLELQTDLQFQIKENE